VRVSVWGSVDTVSDAMRIRIGLPAESLRLAGVRGLPPDYILPLDLHGTIRAPSLDWAAAVRKVAVLSAMQLARPLGAAAVKGAAKGVAAGAVALATSGGSDADGGGGGGGAGAPLARMHRASQVFLQQCAAVDQRLLGEIGGPPPPPPSGPAPWDEASRAAASDAALGPITADGSSEGGAEAQPSSAGGAAGASSERGSEPGGWGAGS
jgi:hypothetical protein